ncbi:MAG: UPF0164 family protein [Spirochaeta sp.]|nr:UPF0164 family protein [Spirochaeta sp.]
MKKHVVHAITFSLLLLFPTLWLQADTRAETYADITKAFGLSGAERTGLTTLPVLLIPIGGRYEGMGTAYTAVSDDAGYFDANPAASAMLRYTEFSLFHNNLIADANLEGLSYTSRRNNFGFGTASKLIHVPFTEYDRYGDQVNAIRYLEGMTGINLSYRFLHDFYFEGIAVGSNLKVGYRHVPEVIEPGQSGLGFMGDFGMLTRFNVLKFYNARERNLSLGISVRNLGPPVLDEPLPTLVTAGIGYKPLRPWLLSFDVLYPIQPFNDQPAEYPGFGVGTALQVTNFFSIQTGFLYRGANPRTSLGASVELRRVRLTANYTLDLTTQLGAVDRFSVEAAFNFGDRGRSMRRAEAEEFYLDSIVAFAEGRLETAVELAGDAVEIDPAFTPAREIEETAAESLRIQRELESIRLDEQVTSE